MGTSQGPGAAPPNNFQEYPPEHSPSASWKLKCNFNLWLAKAINFLRFFYFIILFLLFVFQLHIKGQIKVTLLRNSCGVEGFCMKVISVSEHGI